MFCFWVTLTLMQLTNLVCLLIDPSISQSLLKSFNFKLMRKFIVLGYNSTYNVFYYEEERTKA